MKTIRKMRNFPKGGLGKQVFNAEDAEDFAEERKGVFSANLCEDLRVLCG